MEKIASENERSLTALLRFLNSLAPHNVEHPAAGTLDLTFHIRSREETRDQKEAAEESDDLQKEGGGEVSGDGKDEGLEKLRMVQLKIRTTGGNCKDLVGRQLSAFFQACGVSSQFVWPKGYWDLLSPVAVAQQLAKEDAKAAAASAEVAAIQLQQKQEAKKNHPRLEAALDAINGALEAIASVPWHEALEDKKRIEDQLLAVLVADGWKVGESVKRMWAGERDVRKLCLGLDEGSAKMVARVLVHVQGNDKEHGKMVHVVEGMEGEKDAKDGVTGDEKGGAPREPLSRRFQRHKKSTLTACSTPSKATLMASPSSLRFVSTSLPPLFPVLLSLALLNVAQSFSPSSTFSASSPSSSSHAFSFPPRASSRRVLANEALLDHVPGHKNIRTLNRAIRRKQLAELSLSFFPEKGGGGAVFGPEAKEEELLGGWVGGRRLKPRHLACRGGDCPNMEMCGLGIEACWNPGLVDPGLGGPGGGGGGGREGREAREVEPREGSSERGIVCPVLHKGKVVLNDMFPANCTVEPEEEEEDEFQQDAPAGEGGGGGSGGGGGFGMGGGAGMELGEEEASAGMVGAEQVLPGAGGWAGQVFVLHNVFVDPWGLVFNASHVFRAGGCRPHLRRQKVREGGRGREGEWGGE
ncbi:unnamed protein product [Closterium sp. Naga37s-1]|nr:unnamed protein product [Closterium sp. Naga37s-1]